MYFILVAFITVVSWIVSENLRRKTKKYSLILLENGIDGKGVVEKMLYDYGIYDVHIAISDGILTNYYNPSSKTITLSRDVYKGTNVFAVSVAAHETGHAIQHATAYMPLNIRSVLVPAFNFSTRWVQWIILIGLLLIGNGSKWGTFVLSIGIGLFAITTLFSFITLPIEIDASMRALAWLNRSNIIQSHNRNNAKGALKAAAYTYVVSALTSLATLLYYIMAYMGRRD